MSIFVTGSSGFVGFKLAVKMLDKGLEVVGVDNHNSYYNPYLKDLRLEQLSSYDNFKFYKGDICNLAFLHEIFESNDISHIYNLAAQAGVRYSIENPAAYFSSNLEGFFNILEITKKFKPEKLIYASSSSVYGENNKLPFCTSDAVDHQVSFYGATKRANEILAHSYSKIYDLHTIGFRFFTVYGPWGRPDMAVLKFIKKIIEGSTIELYNSGNHKRDLTYIDDCVECLFNALDLKKSISMTNEGLRPDTSSAPWFVYNISSGRSIELRYLIEVIEKNLGIKAYLRDAPFQKGDVKETFGDITKTIDELMYKPKTPIEQGIEETVSWYLDSVKKYGDFL